MRAIRESEDMPKAQTKPSGRILINRDLLPSRGRYYQNDLYARKLSAIEMKELSKVTKLTVDRVFNYVISSAVTGIDLADIKRNDKLWLIYYLRSITYNDFPMKVKGICPKCKKEAWYDYKLSNLIVVYAEEELQPEVDLPNGDKLEVSFPTIGDEIDIAKIKNDPSYIETIDVDMMTVASHIKKINDSSVSLYEAYEYFVRGKGSAMDYARLITHLKKYAFGAKAKASFECSCGNTAYADVPLTTDFFLPEI